MQNVVRWGILGTGDIARRFGRDLKTAKGNELVAVGSRSEDRARAFGAEFGVPHRHASYQALADDPDVDVVYVATPNMMHKANTLLCLEAGKPVLCEKPFAINAGEAEAMVSCARRKNLFLMEAMWTRFVPILVELRDMLGTGLIGAVRHLQAGLGFRAEVDPQSRLFDPALGGGALLDVGVYPVSLASMIFGPPQRVVSVAHVGETRVDEQIAMVLGYESGALASLYAAVRTSMPEEAVISGTRGQVTIHAPWWWAKRMTVAVKGERDVLIELPFGTSGYDYEVAEVARCLREGRQESDVMPLDESLSIMRTLDEIRSEIGLVYPME
jgi:predicted dehydrogenase